MAKWRSKITIASCLDATVDHRSINGCKWRLQRIADVAECVPEATALRNLLRLVQQAEAISINNVQAVSEQDLKQGLRMLSAEVAEWPPRYEHALVSRRVRGLLGKKNFKLCIDVIDPYSTVEVFNALEPSLPAVSDTVPNKVKVFEAVLFQHLILPAVYAGAPEAEYVLDMFDMAVLQGSAFFGARQSS